MILPINNPANTNTDTQSEVDILARTLFGEARGEGVKGMEAVACVVLNRVRMAAATRSGKFWWGNSIVTVCQKPYQFSCWSQNDPNRIKIMKIDGGDPLFAICLRIARRAAAGILRDFTEGATHYHALSAAPNWAEGQVPLFILGNHVFYKMDA